MQKTTHRSRGAWRRALVGMSAVAALLGAGMVGVAPQARAASEVNLTFQSFPTGTDPARQSFPRWTGSLNMANNKAYFLSGTTTANPYIMDAIFADGRLAYCLDPSEWAGSSAAQRDANYLAQFILNSDNNLRDLLGTDGRSLSLLLGLVMDNGLSGDIMQNDMKFWEWDDPTEGKMLAQWVATQLLIWETVVGERDAHFDHHMTPGHDPLLNVVLNRANSPAGYQTYTNRILDEYNDIVAKVKNDLTLPDFVVAGQTIELTWDGSRFSKTMSHPAVSDTTFTTPAPLQSDVVGDTVTFWVAPESLADAPDGPLTDITMTATKKRVASGLVVWGHDNDQPVGWSDRLGSSFPIEGHVDFRVAAGRATANKILGDHVDDSVTGAGIDYPHSPNWFEYTPVKNLSTNPVQTFDLIAGRDRLKVGTMTVTNNFDRTVTVSYSLKQGLEGLTNDGIAHLSILNGVDELTTVAPGQQQYTMNVQSATRSLDGYTKTVTETTGKGKDKVTREVVKQVAPAIKDVDSFIVYLHTNAKGVINTGYADYDTPFYVKVTGPSYPDGRVFDFSVNRPDQIHLAPGEYRIVEVANAQGDPLDGYWETSYSARKVTVLVGENAQFTITNKHDDDA